MIEVHHLAVTLDGCAALDGVTVTVHNSEVVALVGENGSGKTTLLRVLSTELRPSKGRVIVDGRDTVVDARAVRARVGLMPHKNGLYPQLTPEEHLVMFGRLYGMSRSTLRRRAVALLELADLWDRRLTATRTLSAGMLRRLSLACALIHNPAAVLLDEPTENMDAASRARFRDMLTELKGQGASILMSTHDRVEARTFGDRVLRLRTGRIVSDDTTAAPGLVRRWHVSLFGDPES